jgi:hypothetical protein
MKTHTFLLLSAILWILGFASGCAPRRAPFEFPAGDLAAVEFHGGTCLGGVPCGGSYELRADGSCAIDGKPVGNIGRADAERVRDLAERADYAQIRSRKFTGTCPTEQNDEEAVYYFRSQKGVERIAGCAVAIEDENEPFKALQDSARRCSAMLP